jgi:glycosyltransferase involved in cell wall biosynthesis
MGKPVIATNYSGNLDFMTADNSFLVDCEIVPSRDDRRPQTSGQLWAEPRIDDASRLMRHVYDHRDIARQVGERGRADVRKQLSLEAVGELMKQRLQAMAGD